MLRRCVWFVVLLFVVFLSAFSVVAKDNGLPKLVVHAKYVRVTTYFGDNLANGRIPPEDRQAVSDVEDAVRKWGRYTLVYERENADLILLVRKGRLAGAQEGVGVHLGSGPLTPSIGSITAADAGDPRDTLAVYRAEQGLDSSPIWRGIETDGLKAPGMKLVSEFKDKVEAAAKKP